MEYRDEEINARVHVTQTGSDLYSLKENGDLDESQDCYIEHEDDEVLHIVWYEVSGMEHIDIVDPKTKQLLYFVEIPTIEEAKRRIDLYHTKMRKEFPEDYED